MMTQNGILGAGSNFDDRYIRDFQKLEETIAHIKGLGYKVVLTSGTFDLFHIGHAEYLEAAGKYGDILVVGLDSDKKVKSRKGDDRPVIDQISRARLLTKLRAVHMVILKTPEHPKWALIKAVRPDVLIATKATYTQEQLEALKEFCGQVVPLEPMATTSTSAQIRKMAIGGAAALTKALSHRLVGVLEAALQSALVAALAEVKGEDESKKEDETQGHEENK